jgi:hypothetical protein
MAHTHVHIQSLNVKHAPCAGTQTAPKPDVMQPGMLLICSAKSAAAAAAAACCCCVLACELSLLEECDECVLEPDGLH